MSTSKICTQCGTEYELSQKFCPADGSPLRLQNADDPLIGQMVADRYQILSLIGEGGMGRVYCAEHVRMGRKSAVKVINPALATTADAIARFNREAANACKINHPNVAQVYDFGEMADGTLYLAMEYIDGETLDAIVAREGPLPPMRAAQIAKQVADALHAAHHLGIVHRDLKPENVMVARHLDGSDWVKVVDFGIAKTVQRDGGGSQTVTIAGVSLGTPEYMSPEQLAGERLDHRTDIYSLGLVLFNMLTGELPYPKVTSKETLVRRLTSPPRTLAEVRPGTSWPPGLQEALDRALAPEPGDRFDSVGDFGRAVVRGAEQVDVAPAAVTTLPVTSPTAKTVPDVARDEEPRARPLPRRRVVPWVIGTAVALGAVVLAASMSARPKGMTPALPDSLTVSATAIAPAVAVAPTVARHATPPETSARHADATQTRPTPPATDPRTRATIATRGIGETISDSLRRVLGDIPVSELTRIDSALARVGPAIEQAQRAEQRRARGTIPQRHYWLAPNGDSIPARPLPPNAPMDARTAAAEREIHGHIARMKERFEGGDARGARQEFTMAAGELSILRDLDPDPEQTTALQRELGDALRELVIACNRMRADSTLAPGIRCENFLALPGRFRELRQPE